VQVPPLLPAGGIKTGDKTRKAERGQVIAQDVLEGPRVKDPGGAWTNEKQELYERLVTKDFELVAAELRSGRDMAVVLKDLASRAEDLALNRMDKWMDAHNQFMERADKKDATYATRDDVSRAEKRLEGLELYKSKREGQLGTLAAVWGVAVTVINVALAILFRTVFK